MNKLFNFLIIILCLGTTVVAQNTQYKLPAYRTEKERELMLQNRKVNNPPVFGKADISLPTNIRYPGEFEESQAVCISWSCDYDNNGNITGVDTTSEYGFISAQLAKYISDELPVWIRIPFASDSLRILGKMNTLGWPLTQNYRFFVTTGDDWWMRDYGPNGIYWGDKDSLAFIDLKYYEGRNFDNDFPKTLAAAMGIPNYETTLNGEGGNLMADGFGRVFFSNVMDQANSVINGWDSTQTIDSLSKLFGASHPINLRTLECDGGTGHIDLYTKLVDEQTLFVMEYPSVVTAQDKKIIEDNYQYLTTLKTTYNRPFRIIRVPMPTNDNGTITRKTCNQIDADARTFVNGITLNKTYLYPSYSNDVNGNKQQTKDATALFQKHMPGYKVIPIDARAASPAGGSIHCITMQIPADNPVLFWHPSIDGYGAIAPSFPIEAKITNRSGIAVATCIWRKRGSNIWNPAHLTMDSTGIFRGNIVPGALTTSDTIDYYLEAITNNGKIATKPITAPEGYYTIQFAGYNTGTNELAVKAKNHVFAAYPNPANTELTIPFQLIQNANISISLMDITGKEIMQINKNNIPAGLQHESIDTYAIPNGLYFYSLTVNGERIDSRKIIIKH